MSSPCVTCGQPCRPSLRSKGSPYDLTDSDYDYCSMACGESHSLEIERQYVEDFQAYTPEQISVLLSGGEPLVWFDDHLGLWFCAECGATSPEGMDAGAVPIRDYHWRPKCSQPKVYG